MAVAIPSRLVNQRQWLPRLSDLDQDQLDVINDSLEGTKMVYGPAGGGKTTVTLYRASVLHRQGKHCKIFVYTQVLLQFIRTATAELSLADDMVEPFYTWVANHYRQVIGWPPGGQFSLWVDRLVAHYQLNPLITPLFDYVLLDEAQDFPPNVATLLRLISRHLFVAGDVAQALYEDVGGPVQFMEIWSPLDYNAYFFKNYRNPLHIADFAAEFLDPLLWRKGPFHDSVTKPGGRKPIWYRVVSMAERDDVIAHIIREARGGERIGILFLTKRAVDAAARRLEALGVPVQIARRDRECDFDDADLPVLTTIHSAKGLEFDWVILPGLDAKDWDEEDPAQEDKRRRLFFVAATRAKERLYLISRADRECAYLREVPAGLTQSAPWPPHQLASTAPATPDDLVDLPF